jgi:hypothetical protein
VAITDHNIVAQLTKTDHQLTAANKIQMEQLQQVMNTNAKLVHKLNVNPPISQPYQDAINKHQHRRKQAIQSSQMGSEAGSQQILLDTRILFTKTRPQQHQLQRHNGRTSRHSHTNQHAR